MGRRAVLLAAVLLFSFHASRYAFWLLDDAFISLRYARNLVEGHGLVFNPGERVEGYTNLLWVLLGALWLSAGVDAMRALQWCSVLAMSGVILGTRALDREVPGPRLLPALAWLLPLEAVGYWATTGMETALFAALLTFGVARGLGELRSGRPPWVSTLVFLLLALTRPEGVLHFALACLGFGLAAAARCGARAWRAHLAAAAAFAVAYGGYVAWRLDYYGSPLPNTYYAKVTGGAEQWSSGSLSALGWAMAHPLFALALAGVPAALAAGRLRAHRELGLVALFAWGQMAYVIWVGGDFMPFFRFFLPILPLCAVATSRAGGLALDWLRGRRPGLGSPRAAVGAAVAALALQLLAGFASEEPYRAFVAHRTTVVGLAVGSHLAASPDRGGLLAVNTAGAVPWASRRPTLDMLGLTDATIARHPIYVTTPGWAGHRRGWGAYVVSRRPETVIWYNSAGLAAPHYLGDHQLADDPGFRFFYQLHRERLPPRPPSGVLLERFLGTPFGVSPSGHLRQADLGLAFEIEAAPLEHTRALSAPIELHYFRWREDRAALWPLREVAAGSVPRFVDLVIDRWSRESGPAGDENARREVEALCAEALRHIAAGDHEGAKRLLSQAVPLNDRARSPLVYQYIANLAVLEGQLFLAVHAEQEALRLQPASALYRQNLVRLLSVPFAEFQRGAVEALAGAR